MKSDYNKVEEENNDRILSNPENCGEDLEYNAKRAVDLSKEFCGDCADYHVSQAAKRLSDRSWWSNGAKPPLIRSVHALLSAYDDLEHRKVDIVIAGAGETGIFSTCAHAASTVDGLDLSQVKFTVLDKCRTPLVLCDDFAKRHGLKLSTQVLDLTATAELFPADLIIFHSVLNFIPQALQVGFIAKLGQWLKPDGKIVCWNSIAPTGDDQLRDTERRSEEAGVTSRIFSTSVGAKDDKMTETVKVHIDRWVKTRHGAPRPFDGISEVELFSRAGLRTVSHEEVVLSSKLADGRATRRTCALVIASK